MDETNNLTPQTSEPVVNIEIPNDLPIVNAEAKVENVDNSEVQQIVVEKTNLETGGNEETLKVTLQSDNLQAPIIEEKKTEIQEVKREVGRPCEFCLDRTRIMQKIHLYAEYCEGKIDHKPHVPYLQEMCGYDYLNILTTKLWQWVNSKNHEEEHLELSNTIKMLMERQQLRLLQRSLGLHNPAGAIFQLKANHGMIETEKTLLAGVQGEPLQYNINIVPRKKPEEIEDE